MISKTFEWYRIVSPTPSSQAVEARTKAAEELIGEISAQDKDAVFALAQGVACEFNGSSSQAATFEWLLRKLKLKDPAVSEDRSENQLEVRCIAAVTLGELLFRSEPEGLAVLAASGFVSAMTSRPLPKERYLRAMLEELSRLAIDLIERTAEARRKRSTLSQLKVTVADFPSAQQAIQRLQNQIIELEQNAAMDREEISLFWFMATGFSTKKAQLYSSLPVSVAAVHAALDVDRCVIAPAPLNCFEILASIVDSKRNPEECGAIALKDQLAHWSADEWQAVSDSDSMDAQLALKFPVVFPLTWIGNRMREAQSQPNWTECKKMTHLRGEAKLSASAIARQLLSEKITVSIARETIG